MQASWARQTHLSTRRLGRLHNLLDDPAVGHGACRAIQLGIDRGQDVAPLGGHAVARKEHEGKICSSRALHQPL